MTSSNESGTKGIHQLYLLTVGEYSPTFDSYAEQHIALYIFPFQFPIMTNSKTQKIDRYGRSPTTTVVYGITELQLKIAI